MNYRVGCIYKASYSACFIAFEIIFRLERIWSHQLGVMGTSRALAEKFPGFKSRVNCTSSNAYFDGHFLAISENKEYHVTDPKHAWSFSKEEIDRFTNPVRVLRSDLPLYISWPVVTPIMKR